ncbi:peptidoglycan recognition protein family protein [Chitinophagaceae bacterium LB-8]|uniref:Peptidoglycan recognition protein family protein n=1 Tax=Paraflavisolibacter caeni TaxID=2982496 RepID=A0A9X2XWD8_9BACT|nr:peptidoglycan recognition family protein [Paraflavisolibacter caeni]MCU7549901.1 peptidoglycan recognition protein family protein [Paraflavisolibacter caeni]
MPNWKGIIGTGFLPKDFDSYCHELAWTAWRPSFIVLHNTAVPSLAQRPNGFTQQHMKNLERFYRDTQRWKAGPHLFIDDKLIWVFTPLTVSGTHSPSWNKVSFGVEMLGDYEREDFDRGRGLKVFKNTVAALATLSAILGLDPNTLKLHREDPLTTHACPGSSVRKLEVIQAVQDLLVDRHAGEHSMGPGG